MFAPTCWTGARISQIQHPVQCHHNGVEPFWRKHPGSGFGATDVLWRVANSPPLGFRELFGVFIFTTFPDVAKVVTRAEIRFLAQ